AIHCNLHVPYKPSNIPVYWCSNLKQMLLASILSELWMYILLKLRRIGAHVFTDLQIHVAMCLVVDSDTV
ncbi:19172_t:CDS:1, partial [Racocetra persica]